MEGSPTIRSRVEAKYPALLFKQHLTACVEKIYGMIRDGLKKEISPFLSLCIQVSTLHKIIKLHFYDSQLMLHTGTKSCKDQTGKRIT